VPLVLRSHEIWRELERETGRRFFVENGMLVLRSQGHAEPLHHGKPDFLGSTAALAKQFGIAHEMLDDAALARRFPHLDGIEGAVAYYEPGGGYVIPEVAVEVQLAAATRHGATLRTNTEIARIDAHRDHVAITTNSGEAILADRVVVAAGGWIPALLGAPFDKLLSLRRQTFHWYAVTTAYGDPDQNPKRFPTFFWRHSGGDTGRCYGFAPLPGTREIKVATEREFASPTVDDIDRNVTLEEGRAFYRHHVGPHFRGVAPEPLRGKVCFYTTTPDHDFIIDRLPSSDRGMVISACSGHGFKHSAAIGESVAEHLATGRSGIDLSPFSLARFQKA
jgi:sarcosine oxidase